MEGEGCWDRWRERDVGMGGGRGDVDKGDIGDMKGVEERKYGFSERWFEDGRCRVEVERVNAGRTWNKKR